MQSNFRFHAVPAGGVIVEALKGLCISRIKEKCLFCYMDTVTVIVAGVVHGYPPGLVEHLNLAPSLQSVCHPHTWDSEQGESLGAGPALHQH